MKTVLRKILHLLLAVLVGWLILWLCLGDIFYFDRDSVLIEREEWYNDYTLTAIHRSEERSLDSGEVVALRYRTIVVREEGTSWLISKVHIEEQGDTLSFRVHQKPWPYWNEWGGFKGDTSAVWKFSVDTSYHYIRFKDQVFSYSDLKEYIPPLDAKVRLLQFFPRGYPYRIY